jgi:hypothetical protein
MSFGRVGRFFDDSLDLLVLIFDPQNYLAHSSESNADSGTLRS